MEYEYGRQSQGGGGTYDMGRPSMYQARPDNRDRGNTHSNNNSSSFYPRISQQLSAGGGQSMSRAPPPQPPMGNSGNPSGTGIKVAIKPIYRVDSPAQLLVQNREVPRSLFQFDFDLERRILAEAELQGHHHVRAPPPSQSSQANGGPSPNLTEGEDATVRKYLLMGLSKEAVIAALKTYGDLENKVVQFCPSYTRIREMGFPPDAVAGALAMHDNDETRAVSYLV